jgi:hypothetical protein
MALLGLLTGCSLMPPSASDYWIKPGMGRPSGEAVSLLHYHDYLRGLSAAELHKETEKQRQLQAMEKGDFRRVQYALALMAGSAVADHRRASQLLEPLVKEVEGHDRELRALAILLHGELAERRRLEEGAAKYREEQRRADELEKKLEALKAIEKNLLQRETGGRR